MGFKGTMRSISAASRRWEKQANRIQKENLRIQNTEFVREHENFMRSLISLHKTVGPQIQWKRIQKIPPPPPPQRKSHFEDLAQKKLKNFHPGFLNKLLANSNKAKKKLENAVLSARNKDDEIFRTEFFKWEEKSNRLRRQKEIANEILNHEQDAYTKVFTKHGGLDRLDGIGRSLEFEISPNKIPCLSFSTHPILDFPKTTMRVLQSGKISQKDIPKTRFFEFYQDHVASAMLKAGRELFNLFPDDRVIVNAKSEILNTATGHRELQPIISASFVRADFLNLNFDLLDCSDAVSLFDHKMDFKRGYGFRPVSPISPESYGM